MVRNRGQEIQWKTSSFIEVFVGVALRADVGAPRKTPYAGTNLDRRAETAATCNDANRAAAVRT